MLRLKGFGVGDLPCLSVLLDDEEEEDGELNDNLPDSDDPGDLLNPC